MNYETKRTLVIIGGVLIVILLAFGGYKVLYQNDTATPTTLLFPTSSTTTTPSQTNPSTTNPATPPVLAASRPTHPIPNPTPTETRAAVLAGELSEQATNPASFDTALRLELNKGSTTLFFITNALGSYNGYPTVVALQSLTPNQNFCLALNPKTALHLSAKVITCP